MNLNWRAARRDDVAAIVAMLADDALGHAREVPDLTPYLGAYDTMQTEGGNDLIVGVRDGRVVATYQLTFISGLSLRAARRAQVESVRVASDLRGQGIGRALMADAEARARAAGCTSIQLTTNVARPRAHAFYESLGYEASHRGYKRSLE